MKLARRQQELYDLLLSRGDVAIDTLYDCMGGPEGRSTLTRGRSYAQAWLGGYVTRLNRKLAGHDLKVEPGDLKRTYRLVSTK